MAREARGADDRDPDRLSDELDQWFAKGEDRTIGELVDAFGPRSFAVSFVVLMAFPALPLPTGGVSHVVELATMLLALELVAGRQEVWLPERWRRRSLAGLSGRLGRGLVGRVRWIESYARPRLAHVFDLALVQRSIGVVVFAFGLAAFLAPPFSGLDTLPAMGVVVLSVGVLLRDVAAALAGGLVGIIGIAVIIGIGHAITRLL
jgi:hypothetical protein